MELRKQWMLYQGLLTGKKNGKSFWEKNAESLLREKTGV